VNLYSLLVYIEHNGDESLKKISVIIKCGGEYSDLRERKQQDDGLQGT
jgi:hypothetical protein